MPKADKVFVNIAHAVSARLTALYGGLAQLGEHLPYKQRVGGSSPSVTTCNLQKKKNNK